MDFCADLTFCGCVKPLASSVITQRRRRIANSTLHALWALQMLEGGMYLRVHFPFPIPELALPSSNVRSIPTKAAANLALSSSGSDESIVGAGVGAVVGGVAGEIVGADGESGRVW